MQQPSQLKYSGFKIDAGSYPNLPYSILLMDDEMSILDSFGKLLEIEGFVVHTACNGEQAIALYHEMVSLRRKIDVAVIDLTIPDGMGGIETIARIKEIDPHVRAIATTGCYQDGFLHEYKKYGFMGFLPKPYVFTELLGVIYGVIGKK